MLLELVLTLVLLVLLGTAIPHIDFYTHEPMAKLRQNFLKYVYEYLLLTHDIHRNLITANHGDRWLLQAIHYLGTIIPWARASLIFLP